MQLKSEEIVVTLTLDFFRPVGLYSDRVHVIWTTFLALTLDRQANSFLRCTKLFGEAMSPYAAFKSKLHADDQTGASSCRPSTQAMILQ